MQSFSPPEAQTPLLLKGTGGRSLLVPQEVVKSPSPWGVLDSGQQLGATAAVTHPLMEEPSQFSPRQSGPMAHSFDSYSPSLRSVSPRVAAASISSAASTTSPPRHLVRSRSSARYDEDDWGDSKSSIPMSKLSIQDVSSDFETLKQLMRKGGWRAVIEKVKEAKTRYLLQPPDEQLVYTTFHVLALMKLRNYGAADDVLATLGDLNSPEFRFEHHPTTYPGRTGSMIPFGLRLLHSELPHRLGQTSTTIDRLYSLLAQCNERIDLLQASIESVVVGPAPNVHEPESQSLQTEGVFSKTDDLSTRIPLSPRVANSESGLISLKKVGPPKDEDTAAPTMETLDGSIPEESSGLVEVHKGTSDSNSLLLSSPTDDEPSVLEDVGSNFVIADESDDDFGDFVTSTAGDLNNGTKVYSVLLNRWRRRQEVVLCSVLSHHLNQKDYMVCLKWLEDLVKKRQDDIVVISKFGYVQMQLGDLYGARRTFAKVEAICSERLPDSSSNPLIVNLLARNRGLLYFSLKQYSKARKEFDAVLERDPGDVVSANNKAICLMYSRDLVGATQVLENVLQNSPLTALNETLVLNLCSMYELASMNSVDSKRTLSTWILRIAPDDFDLTCTRL